MSARDKIEAPLDNTTQPNRDRPAERGLEFAETKLQDAYYGSSRRADDDRHYSGNYAGMASDTRTEREQDAGEEWRGKNNGPSHFDENHQQDIHNRPGVATLADELDVKLEQDVRDALGSAEVVDASGIQVTARNGHVALRGTIGRTYDKWRLANLVQAVRGVASVSNDVTVSGDPRETGEH